MLETKNNILFSIISTFFVFFNSATTMAQFPETFTEGTNTFPHNDPYPIGWQVFNGLNGLGTSQQWQLVPIAQLNSNYMSVGYEDVIGGLSEDWLITPQFTVTSIDSSGISFAQKQGDEIDYGSTYKVFVTTDATADLSSSWTLIDSWGESDFTIDWTRRYIELSAYLNIPIYLAFVLEQDDGDSWSIDDVFRDGVCQGQKYSVERTSFYSAIPKDQLPGINLNLNFTGFLDTTTTYSVKLAIKQDMAGLLLSDIPHMDTLIVEDPLNFSNAFFSYDQPIAFSGFPTLIPAAYTFFIYDSGGSLSIDNNNPGFFPTPPGYMHQDNFCTNYCGNPFIGNCGTVVPFTVTDNLYRRFELGLNPIPLSTGGSALPMIIGNTYEVTTAAFLDSVEFFTIPGLSAAGDSVRIVISNVTNGLPSNTIIGQSDYYTYSVNEATDIAQQFIVPTADLTGSPLLLQPGTYFIGFEKPPSTSSYGLLVSESLNATGTAFISINGSSFYSLGDALSTEDVYSPYIGAFLNICSTNTGSETVTECDSYTWNTNGQTYTQSGQYTEVLTNQVGCDSTVTLNLTINSSSSSTQTDTGLDSYTWSVNNQTYTQSGTYTAVVPNASGCDSTITLDLTLQFTGLDENESSYVAVYPNPTYSSFTLATKDMINMNYTLVDIQGKVVLTGKIESTEETVDISKLSKGQYNLVFEDESINPISIIKN